jgi:altronate dehydratase
LWREWHRSGPAAESDVSDTPKATGDPVLRAACPNETSFGKDALESVRQIALIAPTSLCSGQIAQLIAGQLNARRAEGEFAAYDRFVALAHTEGCGVARGDSEALFMRTLAGYIRHPAVRDCLLLEHGCEKTHNDEMRLFLRELGVDTERLGWGSIQADGGIAAVSKKIGDWFSERAATSIERPREPSRIAVLCDGAVSGVHAGTAAAVARTTLSAGGSFVLLHDDPLWREDDFLKDLGISAAPPSPTLDCGSWSKSEGLHAMDNATASAIEAVAALGASGVDLVLHFAGRSLVPRHPMIPVCQIGTDGTLLETRRDEADANLARNAAHAAESVTAAMRFAMNSKAAPRNADFQITRGRTGVSL